MAVLTFEDHSYYDPSDMPKEVPTHEGIKWQTRTIRMIFDDEAEREYFKKEWWHRSWVTETTTSAGLPCIMYSGKTHTQSPVGKMNIGSLKKFTEFYRECRDYMVENYKLSNQYKK